MNKVFIVMGIMLALCGVAAGAFGAHALKHKLPEDMLNAFEVGVRYQMYHALGLILVGILVGSYPNSLTIASGWAFVLGVFVFSGSLYILALTGIHAWGAVTPLGGLLLLLGWLLLAVGILKS